MFRRRPTRPLLLGRPILDLRPGLDRPGVKPADTGQSLALLLKTPLAFLDLTRGPSV